MIERLKNYLDGEFSHIENTKEISDLKDELLANLVDKYVEMIELGFSEDKSFIEAVKSIGDLNEVIKNKKVFNFEKEVKIDYTKKEIDDLLYMNATKDEYIYDMANNKFNLFTMISFGTVIFGFIMFYLLTITTYQEIIGFSVQLIITLIASVVYSIGFYHFNQINQKTYQVFQNKELIINGLNSLRKKTSYLIILIGLTIVMTVPYIILDYSSLSESIITFWYYLKVVPIFIMIGIIILDIIVQKVDRHWTFKLNKISNNEYNFLFSLKGYHYILVTTIFTILLSLTKRIVEHPEPHFIILILGVLCFTLSNIKSNKNKDKLSYFIMLNQIVMLTTFTSIFSTDVGIFSGTLLLSSIFAVLLIISALSYIIVFFMWLFKNCKTMFFKDILLSTLIATCFIIYIYIVTQYNDHPIWHTNIQYIYYIFSIGYIGIRYLFDKKTLKNRILE